MNPSSLSAGLALVSRGRKTRSRRIPEPKRKKPLSPIIHPVPSPEQSVCDEGGARKKQNLGAHYG